MIDFRQVYGTADFFFLRHGESEANAVQVMQGREDHPLSDTGRFQVRRTGEWLKRHPIDRVLSSPLSRCRTTAELVAGVLGTGPAEIREELIELDIGLFSGLSPAECRERYPGEWARFLRESWEAVPGAERVDGLLGRAGRLWRGLIEDTGAGRRCTLCVTHSGILQWIVKATMGQREWLPIIPMDNCGISRFHVRNREPGQPEAWYREWTLINHSAHPAADGAAGAGRPAPD